MSWISLYPYQYEAVKKMKNGCILCGGVGSGKSRTALSYYYISNGGSIDSVKYKEMKDPKDLYIITTARKRDTFEWEGELSTFLMSTNKDTNLYSNRIVVDSWNNIEKYVNVEDAFFIFDEQRVVGYGKWTKSFLKITKSNQWILLSATPGDTWMDYIPVFIANGFYKNKAEFTRDHVIFKRFSKYPQVDVTKGDRGYLGTRKLLRLRDSILVNMDFKRGTLSHHIDVYTEFDSANYKRIIRNRWNIWDDKPIANAAEFCYALRRVVNSDESRIVRIKEIVQANPRTIIFYNFDYELNMLKNADFGKGVKVAEWNGHVHEPIPDSKKWVYLVQYSAGAEGWNCTSTDTLIFFSQNYSYKIMVQAAGRIDRVNTPYSDLYYYHLKSRAGIDIAIGRALREKKKFNERGFYEGGIA